MNRIKGLYESCDINLVVAAKTAGVVIASSERDSDGKTVWYLERSKLLDDVVEQYFRGTLSLPVQPLFYNQRLIKAQISQLKNDEERQ